jgi:hypothetical protein
VQLEFQGRMYRVVYAPSPNRSNHSAWGFLRRMEYAQAGAEKWECMNCERAPSPCNAILCAFV